MQMKKTTKYTTKLNKLTNSMMASTDEDEALMARLQSLLNAYRQQGYIEPITGAVTDERMQEELSKFDVADLLDRTDRKEATVDFERSYAQTVNLEFHYWKSQIQRFLDMVADARAKIMRLDLQWDDELAAKLEEEIDECEELYNDNIDLSIVMNTMFAHGEKIFPDVP